MAASYSSPYILHSKRMHTVYRAGYRDSKESSLELKQTCTAAPCLHVYTLCGCSCASSTGTCLVCCSIAWRLLFLSMGNICLQKSVRVPKTVVSQEQVVRRHA